MLEVPENTQTKINIGQDEKRENPNLDEVDNQRNTEKKKSGKSQEKSNWER